MCVCVCGYCCVFGSDSGFLSGPAALIPLICVATCPEFKLNQRCTECETGEILLLSLGSTGRARPSQLLDQEWTQHHTDTASPSLMSPPLLLTPSLPVPPAGRAPRLPLCLCTGSFLCPKWPSLLLSGGLPFSLDGPA